MGGTAPDIRIFISYRRDDAGAICGSIFRVLKQHFGAEDRVFRDIDSIEPGRPWDEAIDDAVGSCDVCLVLIGPRWLTATDDQGKRRLDDEEDRHRREIEVALERKVRLFPVLLEDTQMPPKEELPEAIRGLRRIQGWRIRDDQTFDWCVEQLIALIEKAAARDADRRREEEAQRQRQREAAEQTEGAAEIEDAERREEVDAPVRAAEEEVHARPEAAERGDSGAAEEGLGSSEPARGESMRAATDASEPSAAQAPGAATCRRCGSDEQSVLISDERYCANCGSPWNAGEEVGAWQEEASVALDDPTTASSAETRACPHCGASSPPVLVADIVYCSECGSEIGRQQPA